MSAIRGGHKGVEPLGVTEDYVSLKEIAERTGRTVAAVDHWVTHADVEIAEICEVTGATLRAGRLQRQLSATDQETLARAVA